MATPLPEDVNVLVLAGDIHIGKAAIELVSRISNALPDTIILFVTGNHEFYKQLTLHP
jgi:calcineurin-like phosphoesterase family protein